MTRTEPDGSSTAPSLINVPNGLTLLRLALVPVFVVLLVDGGTAARTAAFVVFGVASVTDLLDGELARRGGKITDFGKIADPIADKALTGSALITLSALGALTWWVTGIIMVREIGVTLLRFWVIRHGVIPASRGGKIKTVLQIVAIGLYILPVDLGPARSAVMAAAVVVTLVTGADYLARAVQLRRKVPGRERGPRVPGVVPVAGTTGPAVVPRTDTAGGPGVVPVADTADTAGAPGVVPRADTAGAPGVVPRADTAGAPGVVPRADTAGGRAPEPPQPPATRLDLDEATEIRPAANSAGETGSGP